MSKPFDLRTRDNKWVVTIPDSVHGSVEIANNPYDAWLRHRRVSEDGRTWPDQTSFFAGWDALQLWLRHGLGIDGRLSDLVGDPRPSSADAGAGEVE